MAKVYMNRFAIQEDDQFEIHIKEVNIDSRIYEEQMKNAAQEVMLKAQEGSDVSFIQSNFSRSNETK